MENSSVHIRGMEAMSIEQLKALKLRASKILNATSSTKHQQLEAHRLSLAIVKRELELEAVHHAKCQGMAFQVCITCGESKPIDDSYFGFGFRSTGRPKKQCKACLRSATAVHHANNLELGRDRARANQSKRASSVRGAISVEQQKELRKRQKERCAYCGENLDPNGGELDHFIAVERGGGHDLANRVWSCQSCNRNKGRKTPDEFLQERLANGLPIRKGGFFAPIS